MFSLHQHVEAFDGNGLAYVAEAVQMGAALVRLASGDVSYLANQSTILDRIDSNRSAIKIMAEESASIALAGSYGINLTAKDTARIIGITAKRCRRRSDDVLVQRTSSLGSYSSDQGHGRFDKHWKVYYRSTDTGLAGVINELYRADMMLTTENVWDLIPYSFVVDWFADIQNFCDQMDANGHLASLPVVFVVESELVLTEIDQPLLRDYFGASGIVSSEFYNRTGSRTLPLSPVLPTFEGVRYDPNVLTASALTVQIASKHWK
jgi:hypothetical protein